MPDPDLNLLNALDALLAEVSVAKAAKRLGLSASAMSRTLARLRAATGDPLLVRAGRGLVPTLHATELRVRVRDLTREVRNVLGRSAKNIDPATLERVFTIRANEGFVDAFAGRLVIAAREAAPGVRLTFTPKPNKDVQPLREGLLDLEIGVIGPTTGPEVRVQALFQDHFVGVVRRGHPLAKGKMTAARFADADHVVTSRRGVNRGPVDDALSDLGLARKVIVVVPGFPAALAVASTTDLVALVTHSFIAQKHERLTMGVQTFKVPVATAPITVSQIWHPRMDADPGHRWLRGLVLSVCRAPAKRIKRVADRS